MIPVSFAEQMRRCRVAAAVCCFLAAASLGFAQVAGLPQAWDVGELELVGRFSGSMPTGVTVSPKSERIFVCFPRWEEGVTFTVGELQPNGRVVAYPSRELNQPSELDPKNTLYSVQSVVCDARGYLWMLDTGRIQFGDPPPGAAKIVGWDPETEKAVANFPLTPAILSRATYLNDIRIDLTRGASGVAYITDSEYIGEGPLAPRGGGIITLDLASGAMERHLDSIPAVLPDDIQLILESRPLHVRPSTDAEPRAFMIASDGLALSPTGSILYFCPLTSRRLYAVPIDPLLDPLEDRERREAAVIDLGDKPACDGMIADAEGRIYFTAFEHNAIIRATPTADGLTDWETIVAGSSLLWPDTLSIGPNGYLYIMANQLHRQPRFHAGADLRERPFALFRVKIDTEPANLQRAVP